jgi:hypothetical protein
MGMDGPSCGEVTMHILIEIYLFVVSFFVGMTVNDPYMEWSMGEVGEALFYTLLWPVFIPLGIILAICAWYCDRR